MAVDHISTAKAILWEQTKGNLRAMTMASGSGREREPSYEKVGAAVEQFIKDFEDEGYHE